MGLLTDPSAGQGKFIKILAKYYFRLCFTLYFSGIIWFCSLAYTPLNNETYFSENALLPGLAKSEFKDGYSARIYYQELLDEMKKYENGIPYPWLLAKFRQIGLEAYTHNFSLHYPLDKSSKFTGKNVYGIIRAARASSTESLVLSAPYRPPLSVHPSTTASIAVMLTFAKFAYKEKYWSKDIIFLITEHEQLGTQAWLEAYHGVTCGNKDILNHGDLKGRAGAIQAAVNLEFHDASIGQIELKIEGLNGQLPNLDLFNLAARMCIKEDIPHTFKNKYFKKHKDPLTDYLKSFKTLMSMVTTQATGIPTGNHGLFYRFGIQAITLEGFSPRNSRMSKADFLSMGKLLEGTFRSLNNLLERFHQSFFFYLLTSSDRFISIGLYIPSICLLAAALFIKAYTKWSIINRNPLSDNEKEQQKELSKEFIDPDLGSGVKPKEMSMKKWGQLFEEEISKEYPFYTNETSYGHVSTVFIFAHICGVAAKDFPKLASYIGSMYNYSTETSVYFGLLIFSVTFALLPVFVKKPHYKSMAVLNIFSLLEFGTAIICVAMYNISLAMIIALFAIPFIILFNPTLCKFYSNLQKMLFLLIHPFTVLNVAVFIYTYFQFSEETFKEIINRSYSATRHALIFSIVDSEIYGNWLFNVTCTIFFSNWWCFWYSLFVSTDPTKAETKEKVD